MRVETQSFFVNADKISAYIPIASTITNLVDLFLKCVVLPRMNKEDIAKNHYYTHLKEKSFIRCITLLIPVLGNIVIGIYDIYNKREGEKLRNQALNYILGPDHEKDEEKISEQYCKYLKGDIQAID